MKRKDKKNKAQAFLNKYQLGGFNVDDTLMQNPYEYAPDLQTAQQQQLVQFNDPKNQQAYLTPPPNVQQGWDTAIPLISPAINLGIGIKSIIDTFGERKRQKQYERAYKRDLTERMDEARRNDFYVTPYGVPGTNYGSYEGGGSIPDRYKEMGFNRVGQKKESSREGKKWMVLAKKGDDYKVVHGGYDGMKDFTQHKDEDRRERFWDRMGGKNSAKAKDPFSPLHWHKKFGTWQQGGLYNPNQYDQFDFFLDFYNQREKENQLKQQSFQDWYTTVNQQKETQWRDKRRTGIQNALSGAMDIAKTIAGMPSFQDGGLVDSLMQRSSTDTQLANLTSDYFNLYQPDTTTNDSIDAERASYIWNYKKDNPEMFDMLMGLSPDRPKPSKSKRFYKSEREKQDGGTQEYNPKVDLYSPEYDPNEFLGIENELAAAQVEDKEASVIESWLFQDEPEMDELNIDYFNPEQTESTSPEPIEGLRDMPIKYEGDISSMGKSIAVSHNNPGNIKMGKFAEKYGATPGRGATDGGLFARFPDVKTGLKAQRDLLKSGSYANLTVKDAMKRWSNSGYGADLFPEIADKPMYLLTESELIELQKRQIQREDPNMYKLLYLK